MAAAAHGGVVVACVAYVGVAGVSSDGGRPAPAATAAAAARCEARPAEPVRRAAWAGHGGAAQVRHSCDGHELRGCRVLRVGVDRRLIAASGAPSPSSSPSPRSSASSPPPPPRPLPPSPSDEAGADRARNARRQPLARRARAVCAVAAAAAAATVVAASAGLPSPLGPPAPAGALTVAPPPINAYAQRRQAHAYQRYMRELEQRFEALPAADLRKVVEKGGGGINVGYRVAGLSAFLASACSTAIVHPLDTLKTRIQARSFASVTTPTTPAEHEYNVSLSACDTPETTSFCTPVVSPEGSETENMFSGLYNGIQSNILKEAPNAAIYLGVYEIIKQLLLSTTAFHDLPLLVFMIAGCLGDALGSIVRVPAEIVNKRLQLGINSDWKSAVRDGFFTPEGWQMTMLSWEAVLWRDVPYGGLQIALYEFGRQYVLTHPEFPLLRPGLAADVVVGSFAGMIAAVLTTPADVLVTRLSVQNPQSYLETHRYMSVWSTLQRIVDEEGIGGLFAGYLQRGIYYAPLIGLFFSLYQVTTHAVSNPHELIVVLMSWQSTIAQYIHSTAHASSHVMDHVVPTFVRLAATAPY